MTRNDEQAARIPTTLPPPYTSTGTRSTSLRTNAANFTTTCELLVGHPSPNAISSQKPTRFLLHTSLLTQQSPYFRAALQGSFLESTSQSIRLPDVSVEVFELLVAWLYTGDIHPVPFKDGKPAYYTLLHLWILADRLCFEGCRNRVVDVMADLADSTNSVLTPSDTRILYEQVHDDAPIRKLVLDLFAFKKTDKLLATHPDQWHAGFLRDLCGRLKKPCEQAMQRHRLRMWCPESWHATRACDNCRVILPPRYGAVGCDECCQAWCISCIEGGVSLAGWEDGRGRYEGDDANVGLGLGKRSGSGSGSGTLGGKGGCQRKWESCKPWRGSRCVVYHEHRETESCGEVFMGR